MRTSTTFSAISSGYSDDTFYGWSISSTSTAMTFNATTAYSNTTTNVKNNLDENNTLKIYAIYYYTNLTKISKTLGPTSIDNSGYVSKSYNYTVLSDGKISLSGYHYVYSVTVSNGNGTVEENYGAIAVAITKADGGIIKINVNTHNSNNYTAAVKKDDAVSFTLYGNSNTIITNGNGGAGYENSRLSIICSNGATIYNGDKAYRVESHT